MIGLLSAGATNVPRTEIRAKIDDILSRPEFGKVHAAESSAFGRFIARLLQELSDLFGVTVSAASVMLAVVGVLIVTAIVIVTWRAVRSSRAHERGRGSKERRAASLEPSREERVAGLRERARAARSAGLNLLALRLYFTALVVGLGEAGDLEYRDAWTNRELFERGRPTPAVEKALAPWVVELDHKSFGGAVATEHDVDAMSRLVDEMLVEPVKR